MADPDQLACLKAGTEGWNAWRRAHPEAAVDLSDADLAGAALAEANLLKAQLRRANLSGADLSGANLCGADLNAANLNNARLDHADLGWADLSGASLLSADLSGADLTSARLADTNLAYLVWDRHQMRGKYHGIRGLESCHGNALFKRDAADQDYLDTLEMHWSGKWQRWLFRAWGFVDYGRSIARVFLLAAFAIAAFGILYRLFPAMMVYPVCAERAPEACDPGFSAFYFSITTFMTLGLGDVHPRNHWGELVVDAEVTLGYLTLGLMLAVLADKLARRS